MLTNDKEIAICDRFSHLGSDAYSGCQKCPLRKGDMVYDVRCKANSHYDSGVKDWVYDDTYEER